MSCWKRWLAQSVRSDSTVAILLAVLTVVLLVLTAPDIGLTWDEPAYIAASESYIAWFQRLLADPRRALSAESIRQYWTINHEHPPLDKIWSGLIWRVARLAAGDLLAHRLGNIILSGVLIALLYLMVAQELGRTAGLAAAAALITMPRFFAHVHLAALDVPGALGMFAVVYAFWRSLERPAARWDVWVAIVWALALATKVNAVFAPAALFLWVLIFRRQGYLFRRLVTIGLIGVPVFLLTWPWLYREFVPRLIEYVLFLTIDHWKIGQFYLGRFYMPPPWHFTFVIVFAVVPLALTVLYVLGIARSARQKWLRSFGGLLVLCAWLPLLVLSAGRSMVYDDDRLLMSAYPYLAGLSGIGFDGLVRLLRARVERLRKPFCRAAVPVVVALVCFVPQIVASWTLYPHLLAYYSAAVGGFRGAARLGLETTYWCETYARALPYLNAHADRGDIVWVEPWSYDVLIYYQRQGQLDPALRITMPSIARSVFPGGGSSGVQASLDEADFVVIQYRQTGFTGEIRRWLRGREPAYRLSHRGIPLLEIYAR